MADGIQISVKQDHSMAKFRITSTSANTANSEIGISKYVCTYSSIQFHLFTAFVRVTIIHIYTELIHRLKERYKKEK